MIYFWVEGSLLFQPDKMDKNLNIKEERELLLQIRWICTGWNNSIDLFDLQMIKEQALWCYNSNSL